MTVSKTRLQAWQTYGIFWEGSAIGGAFKDGYCRRHFVIRLLNGANAHRVNIHAYTVLENSLYLLLTPTNCWGVDELFKSLGRSYGEYYANRFNRGTMPLRRSYRASEVAGETLVMDVQKLIERRPVDLGIVKLAGHYEWSSHPVNGFGCSSRNLKKHQHFSNYLKKTKKPLHHYREFVSSPFKTEYEAYLKSKIESGQPIVKRMASRKCPFAAKRKVGSRFHEICEV